MAKKKSNKDAENLAAVLEKIPQMFGVKADIGERLHEIIMSAAPGLKPRLWYGMPGYARGRSTPVLVFIRMDDYVTFGTTGEGECQSRRRRDRSVDTECLVSHD